MTRLPLPSFFVCLCAAAQAQDAATDPARLPEISVKAIDERETARGYQPRRGSSATGLALSPRETPQSVSSVTRAQMDDFRLNSVNDVLEATPGVVVERTETDRSYYTARGFDITHFQVDGIGLPFAYGLVDGDLDTAVYERVDVVRGANGLMSGTGNPSATVNHLRKRPTAALRAAGGLTVGRWNDRRVDADLSGPLATGVRARVVAAAQDRDAHLDRYHHRKGVLHAIAEADVGERSVLTVGHTQQWNRPTGVMWGALPLYFSDGTPTHYDRSTSSAARWSYWNTDTGITFAEASHELDDGWQLTAVLTRKQIRSRSKLFYVFGTPDAQTGAGLQAYPSRYELDNTQHIADVRVTGPLRWGGRTHEIVAGASVSRSRLSALSMHGEGVGNPVPDLAGWDGAYPEPPFTVPGGGSRFVDRQRSLYAAARVAATDTLKLIAGANATAIDSEGESYGASRAKRERKVTPYVGAVYELSREWSLYASRTAIFKPQSEPDASMNRLAPATGQSVELGAKAELLDRRLNASAAIFRARQDNLANSVGFVNGVTIYEGIATTARGVELELAGAPMPGWQLQAGWTQLSLKDDAGRDTRTFTPRRMLRVASTWQLGERTQVGAALNLRSATHRDEAGGIVIRQPGYGLLNLMARHDFSDRLSATLNLNNATDRRYLTSLYWSQGYYGAPRHASVSVNWTY